MFGSPAFPINVTYFDKNADANWKVPGHQDLMMPVEREVAEPGFSGWNRKLGVVYVEPPAEVLSNLVALRVHLDACSAANGALAVVPESHRRGKLRDADITAIPSDDFTICDAAAGDILLMKPLLVHRSSQGTEPSHRRVLHIVYATEQPGKNLRRGKPPIQESEHHVPHDYRVHERCHPQPAGRLRASEEWHKWISGIGSAGNRHHLLVDAIVGSNVACRSG